MSIRVHIRIELPGDEIVVDRTPITRGMGDQPAKVAEHELDMALNDARTWLLARQPRCPTCLSYSTPNGDCQNLWHVEVRQ